LLLVKDLKVQLVHKDKLELLVELVLLTLSELVLLVELLEDELDELL
jgi:hypothetical protein